MAHLGGLAGLVALLGYLTWRVLFTLPSGGWDATVAWVLIAFEALPLIGMTIRLITLWNIDSAAPRRITELGPDQRVVVMIPTYNEPVEVIAPTIAAACALQPRHETWVLDDGDRAWVAQMCAALGARYVCRPVHDHAKAGNMNHALDLIRREAEESGGRDVDVIAVLDCDHVPLPTFLTDTLGWFDDPKIALVQAPQSYYNAGAFDDDGDTGEQGVFFHVTMPARNHDGAGPFWCGSTSLIRASALREVGGISTETIVEDMHTTLGLLRAGWKTVFHHQTLAVGLAPATPEQYLLQRRRWGLGSMQVLVRERLWAAKRWLSWRNYYEYLSATVWWMEGLGTATGFLVPALILLTGAQISTANPWQFLIAFTAMFTIRLWGVKHLFRGHTQWSTAFALRVLRIPVGISCAWWLLTRRTLQFQVTPKAGADQRSRGRTPRILYVLLGVLIALLGYSVLGLAGLVPWNSTPGATVGAGVWLIVAGATLTLGIRRIRAVEFATSRRNAHRFPVRASVAVHGVVGELRDLSLGGAAVRLPVGEIQEKATVELLLPGAPPIRMRTVRVRRTADGDVASLRVLPADWTAYRALSLWLFHTPAGAIAGLPPGVPAAAAREHGVRSNLPVLARQYG